MTQQAQIQIWTRNVSFTNPLGEASPQHTFLIKVNHDGTREIIRGGPEFDNMVTDDVGIIRQDYNDIKQRDNITNTYDWHDPSLPNTLN